MPAWEYPAHVSVADYLAGEETRDVKHEYLGGTVHAMAGATNQHNVNLWIPSLKVLMFVESE